MMQWQQWNTEQCQHALHILMDEHSALQASKCFTCCSPTPYMSVLGAVKIAVEARLTESQKCLLKSCSVSKISELL